MIERRFRLSTQILLAGLFAVCVYRAFTQSIVYDEALTWELYIAGPVSNLFRVFDANHHFLYSVLARLSTAVFGVSEWSMRLPALAGAALYFAACYKLARTAFGDSFTMLLAVAVATLNPLVLDFMVAARGYGLALALWMWAAAALLQAFSHQSYQPRQMLSAGAVLALSVTANLIFVVPAAALAGLALYYARAASKASAPEAPAIPSRDRQRHKKKKRSREVQTSSRGIAPWLAFATGIAVIAILFLILAPVSQMRSEYFYTGAASIPESLRSLASSSLAHSGPLRNRPWSKHWSDVVAFVLAPLTVLIGLVVGLLRRNVVLILTAGTVAFSAVALLLIHLLLSKPYPEDRTGIYFLPLAALILVSLAHAGTQTHWRAASIAAYALAVLIAVQFVTEFNTRKFLVWEYDADTRDLGDYLAAHRPKNKEIVRVGGSWPLQESLRYYAVARNWTWIELHKEDPAAGLDFYALTPWDRAKVEQQLGLKEIYRGPVSGSALAVPQSAAVAPSTPSSS